MTDSSGHQKPYKRFFKIMNRYYSTYEIFLLTSFFLFLVVSIFNFRTIVTLRFPAPVLQLANVLVITIINLHFSLMFWEWLTTSTTPVDPPRNKWKKEIGIVMIFVLPIMTIFLSLLIHNVILPEQRDITITNLISILEEMFYYVVFDLMALAVYLYDCLNLLLNPIYKKHPYKESFSS